MGWIGCYVYPTHQPSLLDRPKLSINSSAANSSQSTVNDWWYLTFDWQMFVFNDHLDPVKYFLYSPLYLPLTCAIICFQVYIQKMYCICIENIYIYIYMFSVHIQYLRWQIAYYCKLNHKVVMRATFNQTPHWRCCDLWEWKWMSRWPREIQNKN